MKDNRPLILKLLDHLNPNYVALSVTNNKVNWMKRSEFEKYERCEEFEGALLFISEKDWKRHKNGVLK